jgi:hypothetical protein
MVVSLSRTARYRSNLYGVQIGDKSQGLPSTSYGNNRRVILRRACGNPENRIKIFYGNQVGGVGIRLPTVQKYRCVCTHPIYAKNPYAT